MEQTAEEPERRYVDGRWLCLCSENNTFMEYLNEEWKSIEESQVEGLKEKWDSAKSSSSAAVASSSAASAQSRCVVDGVQMVWNQTSEQWLPEVDVNEDFLAQYHANYGVSYDYDSMPKPEPASKPVQEKDKEPPLTKEEKKAKKREMEKQAAGWVDIGEDKNTNVYVSGLPSTINEEGFIQLMTKCGVIMNDPRTNKPKIKLYRTENGDPKGDGTCCYVKMESVDLSLQILDGWDLDGHKVHVERAQFQLKGEFDPKKKKRKLTNAQRKKFFETQQKQFEWKPEKPRNYRPVCECTVVLKNMFTLTEIDENAARIIDLKQEVEELCARFGSVKKVVVYDTSPDGVITVAFESVEHSDSAVKMLNGRTVGDHQITATLWDGKTKFKRQETKEERERRERAWDEFLANEQQDAENEKEVTKDSEHL
uniref:17S U2 SnRNP complex component HTATSF1 n=1 Tax=Ditylenchus dipsaci TaxID=166011 RepID=A0A915CUA6_9BILA